MVTSNNYYKEFKLLRHQNIFPLGNLNIDFSIHIYIGRNITNLSNIYLTRRSL